MTPESPQHQRRERDFATYVAWCEDTGNFATGNGFEAWQGRASPRERKAITAALRHCQGMSHPLPLTETELDALCKRLGESAA